MKTMKRNPRLEIFRSISFCLLTLNLFFSPVTIHAQSNLLSNGGFENGTTGWSVWGATLSLSTDAHSGSYAAKVSNRMNPWDAIAIDVKDLLVNGKEYTISAWIKLGGPAVNLRATLGLSVDGVNSYTSFFWTPSPVSGSYEYYTETKNMSWNGNLESANLYFENESVGGVYADYTIDDVSLIVPEGGEDPFLDSIGLKDIKSTMLIGGCVTEGSKHYFTNSAAKAQVLKDCNAVTVQCYPGWGRWDETEKYVYHVDEFSSRVREMKEKNMEVTAHMLLGWDQYFPDWYKNNDFEPDTLEAIMQSWLKAIITSHGNDTLVDIWNVVNEAINWDGKGGYWPEYASNHNNACELQRLGYEPDSSGLTGKQFVNASHPVYIRKAFEYARTLTDKKLELRDSDFEFPTSSKYHAEYQLAAHLKNIGAPVDVIGFQTHLDLEQNCDWEGYTNNIKRYRELGYEVIIPEVDIGDKAKNWSDEKAELQKMMYYRLLTAAIEGGARELQTWGFIDDGWRPGEKAFPYTNAFEPKPAYFGMEEALIDMSNILYWKMDETQDHIMPDVMTYNNFGTLHNFDSAVHENGFKSLALQFDGVDDYITTNTLSDTVTGDLTLSCLIKTSNSGSGIIAKLSGDEGSELLIGIDGDGKVFVDALQDGLHGSLSSPSPVNDGAWHFIAFQRDSSSFRLFVDATLSPVDSAAGPVTGYYKLSIGANPDGSSPYQGLIDEVRLYDYAIEEASFTRSLSPFCPLALSLYRKDMVMKLGWINQRLNTEGNIIERKTGSGAWEELTRVDADTKNYSDTVDLYDTEYSYRVKAFNKFEVSMPSLSKSATTPSEPLTGTAEKKGAENMDFTAYPNPFDHAFTLVSPPNSSLKIYSLYGNVLLNKNGLSGNEQIDLSGLPNGIYILKVQSGGLEKVSRLLKTSQ
jgi:GH35 family endo-1,4-beta-xylanase